MDKNKLLFSARAVTMFFLLANAILHYKYSSSRKDTFNLYITRVIYVYLDILLKFLFLFLSNTIVNINSIYFFSKLFQYMSNFLIKIDSKKTKEE